MGIADTSESRRGRIVSCGPHIRLMPGSVWLGGDAQMIIDFHVHHYPNRYLDELQVPDCGVTTYRREDGRLVAIWRSGVALTVPEVVPDAAERLRLMDELSIDTQVLSMPAPNVYFQTGQKGLDIAREVNNTFAEFAVKHPGRFLALAVLPMTDVDLALKELDRALDDLDMRGVMLLTNIAGVALDDPKFEPFWQRANERNLLVYIHPGVPGEVGLASDYALALGIMFLADTMLALARLIYSGLLERYPNVRWVFSHLGGTTPMVVDRIEGYYKLFPECNENISQPPSEFLKRLYFDTVSRHRPAIRCAQETFGIDRLVFGSDYPHIPAGPRPFLEALDALEATEEEMAQVLGLRARRLLDGGV